MAGPSEPNPESADANTRTLSGENRPELALGRPHSVPATIGPYRIFAPLGEGGMPPELVGRLRLKLDRAQQALNNPSKHQ